MSFAKTHSCANDGFVNDFFIKHVVNSSTVSQKIERIGTVNVAIPGAVLAPTINTPLAPTADTSAAPTEVPTFSAGGRHQLQRAVHDLLAAYWRQQKKDYSSK